LVKKGRGEDKGRREDKMVKKGRREDKTVKKKRR
jgi:hypothetical protein